MCLKRLLAALCISLVRVSCDAAPAEAAYPARPVRVIVQGAVGSGPDVLARIAVEHLTKRWQRSIVVVNRPGAGGLMALQMAAAAEHDGYTLFVPSITTFVILPEMHEKLPADPASDFVAIGLLAQTPMVIAATRALPVSTLAGLVAIARKDPGAIFYAANNRGSLPHLAAELWRDRAGVPMTFVPYAGAAAALQDILGGRVSVIVESVGALSGAIKAERIRPLAVASATRLPNYPDLPTVSETTPGFTAVGWFVLSAPRDTPRGVIRKVGDDLDGVLSESALLKRFEELGAVAGSMTPEQAQQFIRAEQKLWRPLVRSVGLTAQ
jgi:tripartite-type tricarboxylate transporter receptor subunit TctC